MNTLPWYKSPVFIGAVTTIISQIIVLLGKQDLYPIDVITKQVQSVFEIIALVSALYAGWKRMRSDIQPLTLTPRGGVEQNKQGGFVRPMMLALLMAIALPMTCAFTGCSAIGLQQPQTLDERIAYAVAANTAVRQVSTEALDARQITSADMAYIRGINDNISSALEVALNAAQIGDLRTAEARLVLVTGLMSEVRKFLANKGK